MKNFFKNSFNFNPNQLKMLKEGKIKKFIKFSFFFYFNIFIESKSQQLYIRPKREKNRKN
jgi:hypothetical protein